MKNAKRIVIVLLAGLLLTGCSRLTDIWSKLQGDVTKSVENLKEEAANVKKKYEETKAVVEQKAQDVENAYQAVKKLTE